MKCALISKISKTTVKFNHSSQQKPADFIEISRIQSWPTAAIRTIIANFTKTTVNSVNCVFRAV
eukprot:SAG25_NODE_9370_length_375_cov_0.724638_1_plen_63_part_10